jgi:hypothetical protein
MLPKLTPLQYLVLHLLFVGRQSGDQLRRSLKTLGVRQSRAAFSRLIARLVEANYIYPQWDTHCHDGQVVHHRCYEVTDLGVVDWIATHKFYLNLAPPSDDLVPVVTQTGQLAAYDAPLRQAVIRRDVEDHVERFASAVLGVDVKSLLKRSS